MKFKKLFTLFLILVSLSVLADSKTIKKKNTKIPESVDSIKVSIDYLKKHLKNTSVWQVENPEIIRTLTGLIHFIEDDRIDSIMLRLDNFQKNPDFKYINRSPVQMSDSLQIRGYHSNTAILEEMLQLDRAIWNGVDLKTIPLPQDISTNADNKIQPIEEGNDQDIIRRTHIVLPDSLVNVLANPDSLKNIPNDFNRIRKRQELRTNLLEKSRQQFNSRIAQMDLDSAATAYRQYAVRVYSDSLQNHLRDSLKQQNQQILIHYNDSVVRSVNDTINHFVKTLQRFAENDSVPVWIYTLSGRPTQLWMRNKKHTIRRFYIKNEQNDQNPIYEYR